MAWVYILCLTMIVGLGCEPATLPSDAGAHQFDAAPSGAAVHAAAEAGAGLPTQGYAHFVISNVAGSGLPNEANYAVEDELVTDLVTGLAWERRDASGYTGWDEAKARCRELVLAGRSDFRLPSRIELVTVLDFENIPVVASAFEDNIADYHWTRSPAPEIEGSAYSVYFGAGETTIARANPGSALSKCVAGEVTVLSLPQFELNMMTDLATDRATLLDWERQPASPSSWDEASSRCASLGMRLPSIRELQSIVDETRRSPAIDTRTFPEVGAEGYWSSTLRGSDPWYVDFTDGKTYADRLPSEALANRCVR